LGRVIGIISGKGGVGKTILTTNLGAALAKKFNKNVVVVDCNITTPHLGLYLGMYFSPVTVNKVLRNETSVEEAIHEHFSGMKVVPASLSLSDLKGVDIFQFKDAIKKLSKEAEIVLLDLSPGLGRECMAGLRACDEVLFVTTPHVPAVMDVVRCLEVVRELGIKPLGIVLNKVSKDKHELNDEEVEQLAGLPVISTIPFDKNVDRSVTLKTPVVLFSPKSKASKELFKLAASLIGEKYETEGIFRWILKRLRRKRKVSK